jgi:hypothetical protein
MKSYIKFLPDSIVPLFELSSDFCVQFVMLSLNLVLVRDDLIGNADRRVVTVVSIMMNLKQLQFLNQ